MDQGTRALSQRALQVWSWLLAGCALAASQLARADVQRFAIVIGNDRGAADEQPLRYAESDARRVYDVLRDLGGFVPANMVLLSGEDARTAEDTIIAINERVRSALALPGSQAMLFVYYSGHADAEALHLGDSELPARRLTQLVHGSAATFRLMVLDACRSGALTRRKGGKIVAASPLLSEDALPGSGLAVLAASAAHEDAQESEEIRASFFTHAFVSGLMGAADQDGDGAVSLSEAYQYSYGATLRATSRTLFGTQHPTFRFDYGGQGAVILTRPEAFTAARAQLSFPADIGFLVLRDSAEGAVVGEVGAFDRRRELSLRPGRYF
ncbi:MAG TPA: caspase family protein, partial [Polyangiales bacterium]|nr:caspase family protein [Polyangiales bacterium]